MISAYVVSAYLSCFIQARSCQVLHRGQITILDIAKNACQMDLMWA